MIIRSQLFLGLTFALFLFTSWGCVQQTKEPAGGSELSAPPQSVTYFPNPVVAAAFAKGAVLFDGIAKGVNYQVHAGRRTEPGQVEIHAKDTDVIYVLDGQATFVTGGVTMDPRQTAPNETRGVRIEGGTDHEFSKGDVIIVPAGTPHWFKQVHGEFHYLVIKVR